MDHPPLRIGIAGLGFGLDVHLPGFRSLPGVEVAGLLGHDSARADSVRAMIGLPVMNDLKTWFDSTLDAVSLALPPSDLAIVAAAALDRGLPVLCEKPLGPNAEVASLLATRAEGLTATVDFELAELDSFVALRDAIQNDVIGPVRHASVMWLTRSRAHRDAVWSWKTDATRHGGVLTLLGTHVFYLLEWLLGPVARVSASLDSRATARLCPSADSVPAEDVAHITLEHRNGCVSTVIVSNADPGIAVNRWTVVGETGSAILDAGEVATTFCFETTIYDSDGRPLRRTADPRVIGDSRIPPFRQLASCFVEAVRAGRSCRPDFTDGARVATLVEFVRQSAQSGTWVNAAPE